MDSTFAKLSLWGSNTPTPKFMNIETGLRERPPSSARACARYVELNPVNAGIVKEAAEYPWSSARFHFGLSQGDAWVRDKNLLGW
jgi:hypothetical protein